MTRPTSGAFNREVINPATASHLVYPTRDGASVAQLIGAHECWVRDTLLWLAIPAKDAALCAAWRALNTRKGTPTWHDLLDALRAAAIFELDKRKPVRDDVSFVPDSDEG